MDVDFDKIFKDDSLIGKNTKRKKINSNLIPGTLFLFSFLLPSFIIYGVILNPLVNYFRENDLILANVSFYLFFFFSAFIAIISELKQPFSTTSIKNHKKGRLIRGLSQLCLITYVLILFFAAYVILGNVDKYSLIYLDFPSFNDLFWFLF